MSDPNPFAPLPSDSPPGDDDDLGIDLRADVQRAPVHVHAVGGVVASPKIAKWPARCVRCNAAVPAADVHLSLSWYPRWVYGLFFVGGLFGLLALLWVREVVVLTVGQCDACRVERRNRRLLAFGLLIAAPLLVCAGGAATEGEAMTVFGGLGVFVGMLVFSSVGALVRVRRVEEEVAYVSAGEPFVASLPKG